ncbi:MAG: transcription elongation factor GreA [Candidatus Margulisiibacteriota bacterium]
MSERVTKSALEKMKKKLEEHKGRRAKISKAIGEARDCGDLKENSAYHAAKEEQGLNEMRIKDLETRIDTAIVVSDQDISKSDKVRLGSTVRVKALDTEDEAEYMIVSEADADVFENKISADSPIGGAVFGGKKGEVVKAELPRGEVKFKILEIK